MRMRCPACGSRREVVAWFNSSGPRTLRGLWNIAVVPRKERGRARALPPSGIYVRRDVGCKPRRRTCNSDTPVPRPRHGRHYISDRAQAGLRSFARRSGVRDRFMRSCPSGKSTQAELTRPARNSRRDHVRNDAVCDRHTGACVCKNIFGRRHEPAVHQRKIPDFSSYPKIGKVKADRCLFKYL